MKENLKITAKVLELLSEGFLLALQKDRRLRKQLSEKCDQIWYTIDRKQLYQILHRLQLSGVARTIKDADGIEKIRLTRRGAAHALYKQLRTVKIKKWKKWDKKWRMVLFDIPETKRVLRNSLRRHLRNLGFLEFQKSVFVYPYHCRDEVNFVINVLNLVDHVYYIESSINPDDFLRKHFKI